MLPFNRYSCDGRTLMVMYTCARCGRKHTDTLEAHKNDDDQACLYLHRLKPPEYWVDLPHGPLLCGSCYKEYLKFMEG